MASREERKARGGPRIKREVGAVAAKQSGRSASAHAAEQLANGQPQTLKGRGGGRAEQRTTVGFRAKLALKAVELEKSGPPDSGDRHDPVRQAPVPRVRRRIEHIG